MKYALVPKTGTPMIIGKDSEDWKANLFDTIVEAHEAAQAAESLDDVEVVGIAVLGDPLPPGNAYNLSGTDDAIFLRMMFLLIYGMQNTDYDDTDENDQPISVLQAADPDGIDGEVFKLFMHGWINEESIKRFHALMREIPDVPRLESEETE